MFNSVTRFAKCIACLLASTTAFSAASAVEIDTHFCCFLHNWMLLNFWQAWNNNHLYFFYYLNYQPSQNPKNFLDLNYHTFYK